MHEDSRREYQTDSDVQALISALADQIAVDDEPRLGAAPSVVRSNVVSASSPGRSGARR